MRMCDVTGIFFETYNYPQPVTRILMKSSLTQFHYDGNFSSHIYFVHNSIG